MELDNDRFPGWTVVTIRRHTAWQIHNFLPLVDSMYSKIKTNYETTQRRLVFDLSELTYFDSTMVSLVLRSVRLTGDAKNALVMGDEKTRDILCLLGIDKLVDLYDSIGEFAAANGAS
jgi:anti-anti-sigma regulatory factor